VKYTGATTITEAIITGFQQMPEYDNAPISFASYEVDAFRTINLLPQTLKSAIGSIKHQELLDAWYGIKQFSFPDYSAPDFDWENDPITSHFDGLQLKDNLGNVVAEAKIHNGEICWIEIHPMTESEIQTTEEKIHELEQQASYEIAMSDNFETAKGLRRNAQELRRKITISKNVNRLAV
jgi:hypothetical protein